MIEIGVYVQHIAENFFLSQIELYVTVVSCKLFDYFDTKYGSSV